MNNIQLLEYCTQIFFSLLAIFIPIVFPAQLFKRQLGIYRIIIIYTCSLLGSYLIYTLSKQDVVTSFTRIFIVSGIMSLISLGSEIRASNAIILGRSEFIHRTVNEIIHVDKIVKEMTENEHKE